MDRLEVEDGHEDLPFPKEVLERYLPDTKVELTRAIGIMQFLQCTTTLIKGSLLIHLLTHLDGVCLRIPVSLLDFCIIPPSILESTYGVPLTLSIVPLTISESAYGVLLALSMIPHLYESFLMVFPRFVMWSPH